MNFKINESELRTAVEEYVNKLITPATGTKLHISFCGGGRAPEYSAIIDLVKEPKGVKTVATIAVKLDDEAKVDQETGEVTFPPDTRTEEQKQEAETENPSSENKRVSLFANIKS